MDRNNIVEGSKTLIGIYSITVENEIFNRGNLDINDVMTSVKPSDAIIIKTIVEFLNGTIDRGYENNQRLIALLTWLIDVYFNHEAAECYALKALTKIIKDFPNCRMFVLIELFCPQSLIYSRLGTDNMLMKSENCLQSVLDCIYTIFNDLENTNLLDKQMLSCNAVLKFLCRLQYWMNFNAFQFPRITFHSLILLKKLIAVCEDGISLYMGELLGTCMAYMFFGNSMNGGRQLRPQKVLPSSQYIPNSSEDIDAVDANLHIKVCGKFLKQKRNRGARSRGNSSESAETCQEYDKSEVEKFLIVSDLNNQNNKNEINAKIRIASIYLFGDVIRSVQQRLLYSYWQSLFPCDIEDNKNDRSDILLVSETDENSKCRCAALQVCADLFLKSKSLFSQAEFRNRSAAFVPLSQKLGLTILSAFKSLTLTMKKEPSLPVLIQSLKCAASLVQVTRFAKFECDFIYDFVNVVKTLVLHNDITVQVSALTVLEFVILEPELPIGAIEAFGLHPRYPSVSEFDLNKLEKVNESSWLILKIFYNLGYFQGETRRRRMQTANPLRIKGFQVLSAMAIHFEHFLMDNLDKVAYVLEEALKDSQYEIRLCGSKCLDAIVYQMGVNLESNNTITIIDKCTGFWVRILPSITNHIRIEKELNTVKVVLIDSISNIGLLVFENLPQSIRISLLSFLTGVCSEHTADVIIRATIVRALSIFATFSSMRINLVFIENTADLLLRLANVKNLIVRIKVMWSMGNISDALLENSNEASNERISDNILWSLIKQASEACSDNDKVRCNAIRTIGNLMRLLSKKHFVKASERTQIKSAFEKLIDGIRSSGTSKVKWNSCYAIGNFLQNENIYVCMDVYKDLSWQSSLYSALCHAICSHSNYKVKINATTAILHIGKRSYIGEYCGIIWKTIIGAVEQSNNLLNFYEYNHRDLLQEQLILLLSHIIILATIDDYIPLSRMLMEKVEVVRNTWIRVTRRMIPEKAAPLLSSSTLLLEVLKYSILSVEQRSAVKLILDAIPANN